MFPGPLSKTQASDEDKGGAQSKSAGLPVLVTVAGGLPQLSECGQPSEPSASSKLAPETELQPQLPEAGLLEGLPASTKPVPECELPSVPEPKLAPKPSASPKPSKVEQKRVADWDYKLKRAELWVCGVKFFSAKLSKKSPKGDGDSRVLASFEGVGDIEVAGIWWWMTLDQAPTDRDESTPVVRKPKDEGKSTSKGVPKSALKKTKKEKKERKHSADGKVQAFTSTGMFRFEHRTVRLGLIGLDNPLS